MRQGLIAKSFMPPRPLRELRELREVQPEGYGYSRFCDLRRGFERRLTPVMRQHHDAGEKAFVDYSGKRSSACSAP